MNKALKYGILLASLGLIVGLLLSITNYITKPIIEKNELNEVMSYLSEVDNSLNWVKASETYENIESTYLGKNNKDEISMYAFKTKTMGYSSGDIVLITFIDNSIIKALKILKMTNQTSGIGTNIQDENFLNNFIGKNVNKYANTVVDDYEKFSSEIISGATISSKALLGGVIIACNTYLQINESSNKDVILDKLNEIYPNVRWGKSGESEKSDVMYNGTNEEEQIEIYAYKCSSSYLLYGDYYADLDILVFIKDNKIFKIIILNNSQTSEYGIKINDQNYLDSFIDKNIDDYADDKIEDYTNENNDIISGSTITSKAFVNLVIYACYDHKYVGETSETRKN